jgi:hypothetical protein
MNRSKRGAYSIWLQLLIVSMLVLFVSTTACSVSPQTVTELESIASQLAQNKSLIEQSVRDVAGASPGARSISQLSDDYEDMRDSYNRYLDALETSADNDSSSTDLKALAGEVKRSARAFFKHSARTLGGSERDLRAADSDDILCLPGQLPHLLKQLPRRERLVLSKQFRSDLALKPWRQIN